MKGQTAVAARVESTMDWTIFAIGVLSLGIAVAATVAVKVHDRFAERPVEITEQAPTIG